MNEWDLMKKAAELSNNGYQDGVSKIILENNIEEMKRLTEMLISVFTITKDNVARNLDAAEKLSLTSFDDASFRGAFRLELLKDTVKELKES